MSHLSGQIEHMSGLPSLGQTKSHQPTFWPQLILYQAFHVQKMSCSSFSPMLMKLPVYPCVRSPVFKGNLPHGQDHIMGLRRHPADPEVIVWTNKMLERSCSLHPSRVGLSKCEHIGHVDPTVTVETGPPPQLQDGRIISAQVGCGGVAAHHHEEALGGGVEERREGE